MLPITAHTMKMFSFWDNLKKPHGDLGVLYKYIYNVHVIIIIIILIRKFAPKLGDAL